MLALDHPTVHCAAAPFFALPPTAHRIWLALSLDLVPEMTLAPRWVFA